MFCLLIFPTIHLYHSEVPAAADHGHPVLVEVLLYKVGDEVALVEERLVLQGAAGEAGFYLHTQLAARPPLLQGQPRAAL